MAEYNLDTPPNARSPSTDRPAVGIRLSPDVRSDAVAGAILRAERGATRTCRFWSAPLGRLVEPTAVWGGWAT